MKTFEEWMEERDAELYQEINWKSTIGGALTGAALTAGAFGLMGNKTPNAPTAVPSKSASFATSDDADDYLKGADPNYNWNSQIGRYTVKTGPNGETIYQSAKGNFVLKKNVMGRDKFIPVN